MGATAAKASTFRFGTYELDLERQELRKGAMRLKLKPQPFKLLALLVRHSGEVVTREQMREEIWGSDVHVDFDQGLKACIRQIRGVLNDDADQPRYIETVARTGYRFIGQVAVSSEAAPAKPVRPGPIAAVLAFGILLAATVGYLVIPRRHPPHTIAVLPFVNLSGDNSNEYFSDGLTDEIIHALSGLDGLQVTSSTSSFALKGKGRSIAAIGARLNVEAVVEGSVQKTGQRLRVTVQLIRVSDDRHLWSARYDKELKDVFAIEDEISRSVATRVVSGLSSGSLVRPPTGSLEAYDLFLRGLDSLRTLTPAGIDDAIALLTQATEIDPRYARAYAALADAYSHAWLAHPRPIELYPKALKAAHRALELDDTLALAHAGLANVKRAFEFDWTTVERENRRAIELSPNDAMMHQSYARQLGEQGRFEECTREIKRAMELDPLSAYASWSLCGQLYYARRYDESIEQCRKTLALDPGYVRAYYTLARTYVQKMMYPEALAAAAKWSSAGNHQLLAYIYAAAGRREDALREVEGLKQKSRDPFLAWIYAALGDKDRAFESLEKAYAARQHLQSLKVIPEYDPLRSDPRFAALLRKTGLAP